MGAIKVQMSDRMKRWAANGDKARLEKAVAEGTRKLLPMVEDAVKAKLDASLQNPTGKYRRTIGRRVYPTGTGVVSSGDRRKLKNWLETRVRGGKKLGKGAYAWRAGKTFARNANKSGFYKTGIVGGLK